MFQDKVCVITGGALGIGQVLTQEFAGAGAKIAFIDINKEAGEKHAQVLKKAGHRILFMAGDISEEAVLRGFVEKIIDEYGKVDFLINNAAVNLGGILSPCGYDDFNRALRVGISAPYILAQLLLPHFNVGASIVNISSTRALMSQANTESYSAAKGGINALTHALAVSLAGKVRVNAISPGWIDTGKTYDKSYQAKYSKADKDQHPSKRVGYPLDIASLALFLCDEKNSFINGENITVDGGMSKLMIYSGDMGWEHDPEQT